MKNKGLIIGLSVASAVVVIAIVIYFVMKSNAKKLQSQIDAGNDVPVGANEKEEALIAATQGIDVNTPGWRKKWELQKILLLKSGYSKRDIRTAKKSLKADKVKTGKGWQFFGQLFQTAGEVAGSASGSGSTN
jgi:hypothetical protein